MPPESSPSAPRPRAAIEALKAYVPGEQPKIPGLIKLNTNENPAPPSPAVIAAGRAACDERLRTYSDPGSTDLREAASSVWGVDAAQIIAVNGSDEILRMVCTAYLDPGESVATLWPTYSLYDTLVETFGGVARHVAAQPGDPLPIPALARPEPRVIFLANPNPPLGTYYPLEAIKSLVRAAPRALVVLDEAYIDFAPENALGLIGRAPNLLVTRTMSKSYSLAGMRLGFGLAGREIIATLEKVKDSYNLDRVAQAVGAAALRDQESFHRATDAVIATRERVATALRDLGFDVPPSAGNFIFPRRGPVEAETYFTELRKRNILVRYFRAPELRDGVRISVGSPADMDRLIEATREILKA